jgi:hypothetical protein
VSLSAKPRSNNLYKVNFLCRVYDDFEWWLNVALWSENRI